MASLCRIKKVKVEDTDYYSIMAHHGLFYLNLLNI